MDISALGTAIRIVKYTFGLVTAGLTVFSLTNEVTLKEADAQGRKRLTKAGTRYLAWLLSLAVLTAVVTAIGDISDDRAKHNAAIAAAEEQRKSLEGAVGTLQHDLGELDKQVQTDLIKAGTTINQATKASTEAISQSQDSLLKKTSDSVQRVTDLQSQLKDSRLSISNNLLDLEQVMQEAARRVKNFYFQVEMPNTELPVARFKEEREPPSLAAKLDGCAATNEDQGSTGARCAAAKKEERMYDGTHLFAESVYPGRGYVLYLKLQLSRFDLLMTDRDCGLGSSVERVQPCFSSVRFYERWTSNDLDVSTSGTPMLNYTGAATYYNMADDSSLEMSVYSARDFDIKGLLLQVCSTQQKSTPINAVKDHLPNTLLVVIGKGLRPDPAVKGTKYEEVHHEYSFSSWREVHDEESSCRTFQY